MCVLSKRGSFIPHACLEFRTTLKRYFSIGLRRKFTPGVLRTYVCISRYACFFFRMNILYICMYEWVLWNKSYTCNYFMKIIFFFGTKISKKKLGENILWHTHITSLSFRSSILVIYRDLSWITVNVVIVLSCEYLWFPVISKGSNVPGQIEKHKKPQETTRNSLFFCEDCEDFRCRSKAHFCNTVN